MAEKDGQDKSEQATPQRLNEAREEGQVAKSSDVGSAVVLMTSLLFLTGMSTQFTRHIVRFAQRVYHEAPFIIIRPESLHAQALQVVQLMLAILAPLMLVLVVAGLAANYIQIGFMFSPKAMKPKFSKLNPISGLKKFISIRSLVELVKGLVKLSIVASISYYVLQKHIFQYAYLATQSISEITAFLLNLMREMGIKVGIALLFMAAADYAYQRWQHEKDMMMTKQEVRDESKQYEGDPQLKGRIRSKQREISARRLMAEVPQATVIVTNPVHLAVALRYDPVAHSDAPKVVAKGQRKVAEKIKEIGREHGVPIVENKPLARSLYKNCEIGMEIPEEFYQTVAEILSEIYRQDNQQVNVIKDAGNGSRNSQ